MSYIDRGFNTYITADGSYILTPMIVDIIAIQNLYGTPTDINTGDTVYGYHSNVDGYLGEFFKLWTEQDNPFVSINTNLNSKLDFADLDGDDDLDLVVGGIYNINYFENTGTATNPDFTQRIGEANPLDDINDQLWYIDHTLADIDNDSDVDLIVVDIRGTMAYYENTGTATSPSFTRRTGAANPLDSIDEGLYSDLSPALADLDDDGDIDLILLRDFYGNIAYFENTGTATTPVFTHLTGEASPLDGIFDESSRRFASSPDLADLDGDGDIDLIIGEVSDGQVIINYYENTGTVTNLQFTQRTDIANPLAHINGNLHIYIAPVLVDIDDDGDLDLAFGNSDGNFHYAENAGTASNSEFIAKGLTHRTSFTLYDNGGTDTLDLHTDTIDQQVDLRPEGISDVYGEVGNLIIARDILIENFIAGFGNDVVIGNDRLWGNGGDDVLEGGAGADQLHGENGMDTASYTNSPDGVTVRLHSRATNGGDADGDTFPGLVDVTYTDANGQEQSESLPDVENLTGSAHSDVLAGDRRDNVIDGGGGNDTLYGGPGGGDDEMTGGPGNDRLFGGQGDDTLRGGPGEDRLVGGPGEDVFVFSPGDGADTVTDFFSGTDKVDLTAFDIEGIDDISMTTGDDGVTVDLSDIGGGTILLANLTALPDAGDFLI